MSTLTKDQIRQLTPEQQETLASIEVQRVKKREQLLWQARHYRGQQWLPALALVPLYFISAFTSQKLPPSIVALILSLILWMAFQNHLPAWIGRVGQLFCWSQYLLSWQSCSGPPSNSARLLGGSAILSMIYGSFTDMSPETTPLNKPDAANPAMTPQFHSERQWRGVVDLGR